MLRIRLVVTGDLEKAALGPSLERVLQAAGADVSFDRPLLLSGGAMTTSPLPDPSNPASRMPTTVRRMANALVTETFLGPSRTLPDLVVGIDDLELANIHQPHVVTAWLRRAVHERIVERFSAQGAESPDAERAREALRKRCSFHLLVPLSEAYFFGDAAALTRAGVPQGTPIHRSGTDVEAFETDDPEFLPIASKKNAEMAEHGCPWWREERHPKRYLEFLVGRSGGLYQETEGGVRALEALDWPGIGADPQAVHFARALFEDLSDALAIPNALGAGVVSGWTYPARTVRRETLTLRNL
ncbi:hypothetical protein [Sorangium sp. So ce145]|uniref:hypothetical protein n=1 Tax=Sorangium sp. So ce145 TaxID=3133285 RepID=UPI003F6351D5